MTKKKTLKPCTVKRLSITCLLLFLVSQAMGAETGKKGLSFDNPSPPASGTLLKWIDAGGGTGLRLSTLYSQGEGLGLSPDAFARCRFLFRYNILLMAEAGYYQSILPVETGTVKGDFFTFGLLTGYNYSIIDRERGSLVRNLSLYGFTGPVMNTHLSSQYEKSATGEVFNFDAGYNMAFLTWMSGAGISLQVWKTVFFLEAAVSVSLGNSLSGVASDEIIMSATGETGVSIRLGTQLRIMPW